MKGQIISNLMQKSDYLIHIKILIVKIIES